MEKQEKTLSKCPYCFHAKWVESPTHLCGPHEPVLVIASKYGYTKDFYDFPAHTAEFYEVRAKARLAVIEMRHIYRQKHGVNPRPPRPHCACANCKLKPGFHFYIWNDTKWIRYQHGTPPTKKGGTA